MIQTLYLVLYFLRHFLALPRFFLAYWKSFFPSTLLRNVGPQKEMHILLCLPGGNHIHHMINKSINGAWVRYLGGLHILHEPIQKGVGE